MSDSYKKDAQRKFRSEGAKKGRTATSRAARRASKRGSKARVNRVEEQDEKDLTSDAD